MENAPPVSIALPVRSEMEWFEVRFEDGRTEWVTRDELAHAGPAVVVVGEARRA